MSAASERHNELAPLLLRKLVYETETESERLVVLESLLLGVMLFHQRDARGAGELLDSLTARVIERMPSLPPPPA